MIAILLDENVPPEVGTFLRSKQPDWRIIHATDIGLKGAADAVVFAQAQTEGAIILTLDEDFADTRIYPAGTHAGVIRLRVWPTTIERIEGALLRLIRQTDAPELAGSLVIIDNTKIRIRRLSGRD